MARKIKLNKLKEQRIYKKKLAAEQVKIIGEEGETFKRKIFIVKDQTGNIVWKGWSDEDDPTKRKDFRLTTETFTGDYEHWQEHYKNIEVGEKS